MVRYNKVKKRPSIFLKLFGVTPEQADFIIREVKPLWEKKILGAYKRPGRDFKLDLEEMVLMVLVYYRSYVSQVYVGFLFGIDDSRVCRLIQRLEPLLAHVVAINKNRTLSQEDVEQLIDATEQPIERPKQGQKKYYSGKKKRHTLKTEIRTTLKGKIIHVSKAYPGATHDFALHKNQKPIDRRAKPYGDGGYQGIDQLCPYAEIPYKKPKGGTLTNEEKLYNRVLSRIRVTIEHTFAQIKTFNILSHTYRNKRKRYSIKFNIIAGIVNIKNGFLHA